MSRIDELIRELCPNGVEFKALGEVGEFVRGKRFTKHDYVEHGLGAIHYGEIYTTYGTAATETLSRVRSELRGSLRLAATGDLVVAATGENARDVGKAVAWLGEDEVAVHDDCYIYKHQFEPRFVAYYFQSALFQEQKIKMTSESKLARVSAASLAKIVAPVPPRDIQREIVGVLDEFSALEAQLEAELKAEAAGRQHQYSHYRNLLLNLSSESVGWMPLSRVADVNWGDTATTKRSYVSEGQRYPAFSAAGQDGYLPHYDFEREGVVLSAIGALAGKTWRASGKWSCIKNTIRFFSYDEDTVATEYLFWITSREAFWPRRGSAQPFITKGDAEKVLVPIPTMDEQKRIVDILDRFDSLATDLSVALSTELAARRKQYEYYRDRLLTFPVAAARF